MNTGSCLFKTTEILSIKWTLDHSSLDLLDLDESIDLLPSLRSLHLSIHQLIGSNAHLYSSEPNAEIECLTLSVNWLTDVLLNYIVLKFPNLRHFELIQNRTSSDRVSSLGNTSVQRFASYLAQVDYFRIVLVEKANREDLLDLFDDVLCDDAICRQSNSGATLYINSPTHPNQIQPACLINGEFI
ncbi:hypothetical protein A0J61_00496 [Choanephora cucurbitarum]|uniref:F-box domain-containing protein n=1 Tax=Choanephora cucurbitarum TaxID=101091 RepID=A0A1C7NVE1_9FUNG|nr:hypothetical protein A0J61_00496 [Choanephora cucurbitarum]